MAIGNLDSLSASLAKMTPQQRQQYAAMHKNDPMIVALAKFINDAEQQKAQALRGAQLGQQGQPPKVVDQTISSMAPQLPEDMGIAKLPTPNMQAMADGGIAGYAEGGEVDRYQDGGRIYQRWRAMYPSDPLLLGTDPNEPLSETLLRQLPALRGVSVSTPAEPGSDLERRRRNAEIAQRDALMAERYVARSSEDRAPTPAPGPGPASAAAPSDAPPAPTTRPAAVAAPSLNINIPSLMRTALDDAAKAPNPFATAIEQLGKDRVDARKEDAAGLEAIHKRFDDIYKGRRERMDTREAELGKMKDQATGLALLQAGAAIMSTPGSLGTAVGKGVQAGASQYAAGMEKLQSAKERLSDARDRLEEIEAQRGEMSARELLKARSEVKNEGLRASEDLIKSNMQMYGLNRTDAVKMVEQQIKLATTQYEQNSANARTAATVNAPSAQERLYMALGGGDIKKGLEVYAATMGPEAKGDSAILAKYSTLEGQMLLKNMETSTNPQERALAQSIRARLQAQMLTPMNAPTGPVRP